MKIAENITELVGNTPLVRIHSLSEETGNEIIGKVEYFNPLSSIKDRIALNMITEAEQSGKLKPGGTIVEPTSGNTGIGLAFTAAARGYKLILTMPDTLSVERRKILKALGAELILTPGSGGMKSAIQEAERIAEKTPGSYMPSQFQNPANPDIHRKTTAQEIIRDTDGQADYFVAGVGTGGTITGTGEVLKAEIPGITIVAVEPQESSVLSGEKPGPHKIQGIGAGFIPEVLNTEIIDVIQPVSSLEAAQMTRRMAKSEGLLLGISCGAALEAARKQAEKIKGQGKRFIVILPDTGERYLSTWLFED
ncbi:MAG: cysteine synthase A [Spirochaetales bacterium]|nr:cysteine synthase A [Spirochaetales bacterium]